MRFNALLDEAARELACSRADVAERCHLIEGDIELANFGLSASAFHGLAGRVDTIFHSAAAVALDMPIEEARRQNVAGTRTALALAEKAVDHGGLRRLFHVSTAYVAGQREGVIREAELNQGQKFNNAYEQAKFEAELLLQTATERIPITIFRPSMVMGDSQTGWTNSFNVLYTPIKWGYYGKLRFVPGGNRTRLDTVPIDFVVRAILHLAGLEQETLGKTFHLTVGEDRSISLEQLMRECHRHFVALNREFRLEDRTHVPRMLHPSVLRWLLELGLRLAPAGQRRILEHLRTYSAYTFYHKEFNTDQAAQLLGPAGITVPALVDYLPVLCRYCVATRFGSLSRNAEVPKGH